MKVLELVWFSPALGWIPRNAHPRYNGCSFKTQEAARDEIVNRRKHKVVLSFRSDARTGMTPNELDAKYKEFVAADFANRDLKHTKLFEWADFLAAGSEELAACD